MIWAEVVVQGGHALTLAELAKMVGGMDAVQVPFFCGHHPHAALLVAFNRVEGSVLLFCPEHPAPVFLLAILVASERLS